MCASRLVGKLLIAEPMLADPNFDRAVVLIVQHGDDDGALGVVLNRPSDVDVAAVVAEWHELSAQPTVLYMGGPVEPNGVLALARRRDQGEPAGWIPVLGDVGMFDLHSDPSDLAQGVTGVRFFLGYAGWAPGQLESELEAGAWLVVEALADDVFTSEPADMWRAVLRRQGGTVSRLANFPTHPSMN